MLGQEPQRCAAGGGHGRRGHNGSGQGLSQRVPLQSHPAAREDGHEHANLNRRGRGGGHGQSSLGQGPDEHEVQHEIQSDDEQPNANRREAITQRVEAADHDWQRAIGPNAGPVAGDHAGRTDRVVGTELATLEEQPDQRLSQQHKSDTGRHAQREHQPQSERQVGAEPATPAVRGVSTQQREDGRGHRQPENP